MTESRKPTEMLQPKLLPVFSALAMIALAVGACPAKAGIVFGDPAIAQASCIAPVGGQPGSVCSPTLIFNNGTDTITANGFTGAPVDGPGNTNLTRKLAPPNSGGEGGLGVSVPVTTPPAGPCSDEDCEIVPPNSVTAVDTTTKILDAVIGSVQAGETFNFFIQTTAGGAFTQLGGGPIGSACNSPNFKVGPFTDTCEWDSASAEGVFGVAVQGANGNVLLTSVSTTTPIPPQTPEPASLALLGTGLIGLGLVRRRRQKA